MIDPELELVEIGYPRSRKDQRMENVILITVDGAKQAYEGMANLRRLADRGVIRLHGAAIIERQTDGSWDVREETEDAPYRATIIGGLIGSLLGLLAGPDGLLLGGTAGLIVGSAADTDEVSNVGMILNTLATKVPPGWTALVADVDEWTPEPVNALSAQVGGRMERLSRVRVEAELAAIEQRAQAAEKEAEEAERIRRRAEGEETIADRLADLKDRIIGQR